MSEQKRVLNLEAFSDGGWFWETPMAKRMEREADEADEEFGRSVNRLLDHLGVKKS